MKKLNLILAVILFAFGCKGPEKKSEGFVNVTGNLKAIMREGKTESRVKLDTLVNEHLYAVGALTNLAGELTVIDGQVYTAKADGSISKNPKEVEATLLIYSHIEKWDTVHLSLMAEFEKELGLYAESIPFTLTGRPEKLVYHIINFKGDKPDFANHKEGAFTDTLRNKEVTIVGFYSDWHHGVFTHHDTDKHMHFVDASGSYSGHVDELELGEGNFLLTVPAK